jgi:hypothetical protein
MDSPEPGTVLWVGVGYGGVLSLALATVMAGSLLVAPDVWMNRFHVRAFLLGTGLIAGVSLVAAVLAGALERWVG